MKVLFLDDSFQKKTKYLGYGGFCVGSDKLRSVNDALSTLKKNYKIPNHVELKWSCDPEHYLRTKFKGSMKDLIHNALNILQINDCKLLVAAHSLSDCYGYRIHQWTLPETIKWATREQLKYLSERFSLNLLEIDADNGIVIIDNMPSRESESYILRNYTFEMMFGTTYSSFDRISMVPLLANSKHCTHIQLADLVVGILISALSGSEFAKEFLQDLAPLFVQRPVKECVEFSSTWTSAVIGYGIVLFPKELKVVAKGLFNDIDKAFIAKKDGIFKR